MVVLVKQHSVLSRHTKGLSVSGDDAAVVVVVGDVTSVTYNQSDWYVFKKKKHFNLKILMQNQQCKTHLLV